MFCNNCGAKITDDSSFCENCGHSINNDRHDFIKSHVGNFLLLFKNELSKLRKIPPVITAVSIVLFIAFSISAYSFYKSYRQTQLTIQQTTKELADTKAKLSDVASSTSEKLVLQEQELTKKTGQIEKLEAQIKKNATSDSAKSINGNLLTSLSPSVVKIICATDAYSDDLQIGSGVLYQSATGNPASYFIETNQHVVQTDDGSLSQCAIAIYPNYTNTSNYLLYKSSGYKIYKYGVDFAYIIPQIANSSSAGTLSDLSKYAKSYSSNTYCKSASIGERISILGYPSVGGSSLTATDGIIAGFEYDGGVRFIKTSAKIEHGNSGGIAIKDSGCVLGIPTYVETGSVESIGRILDLNDLFNN